MVKVFFLTVSPAVLIDSLFFFFFDPLLVHRSPSLFIAMPSLRSYASLGLYIALGGLVCNRQRLYPYHQY